MGQKIGKSGHSVFIHTIKTQVFFLCISDFDLNAQLCTYKKTSDERHYQHFYRCNTCNIYVCIVCKEVCHHGHDVVYRGYFNSYCDCGIRGDESCKALTQRASTPDADTVEQAPTASSPLLHNQGKYLIRAAFSSFLKNHNSS